jgi:hypothetical protein
MRFPNMRYGNPNEFSHYVASIPIKETAKRLRRSERTIRNWLDGTQKIPWGVPEITRLQNQEHFDRMRYMNMVPLLRPVGTVIAFPDKTKKPHQVDDAAF